MANWPVELDHEVCVVTNVAVVPRTDDPAPVLTVQPVGKPVPMPSNDWVYGADDNVTCAFECRGNRQMSTAESKAQKKLNLMLRLEE